MPKAAVLKKSEVTKKNQAKTVTKSAKPAPAKPVLKVVKPAAVVKETKAPQKPAVQKPAPQKLVPQKPVLQKPALQKPVKKLESSKKEFKVGHHVVYPTHGVGRIVAEETQEVGGISLKMLVIAFDKDKMTLRVPVHRAQAAGLRHISGGSEMEKVFTTLKGKAKISRGMWSRRAQEYEGKINSGCVISVAEVVRDLHQNVDQAERSYSERMIYESALSRLVGELAAAENMDSKAATDKLMKLLRMKVAA